MPLKVIDKSTEHICYKCSGTGQLVKQKTGIQTCDMIFIDCDVCKGTGKFKETFYHLIDQKNNICFGVDNLGK